MISIQRINENVKHIKPCHLLVECLIKKNLLIFFLFYSYQKFTALGGHLFNFVFGYNFDLHRNKCSGQNCYSFAFYFSAFGVFLGICMISSLLWWKIRNNARV